MWFVYFAFALFYVYVTKEFTLQKFWKITDLFKQLPLKSISVDSFKLNSLAYGSLSQQAHGLVGERQDRPSRL